MSSLAGKTAVVTGAGRGIGRAIAINLAQSGCRLILTARTLDQLEAVQQEISRHGGEAACIAADLTRDEEIDRLVTESSRYWEPADFLINNAGWGKRASVVKGRQEDWDQTFRLNLRAPMILAKALVPPMIERAAAQSSISVQFPEKAAKPMALPTRLRSSA